LQRKTKFDLKRVLIFNSTCFPISETFIYRQIQAIVRKNQVVLCTLRFMHEERFPLDGIEKVQIRRFYNLFDRAVLFLIQSIKGNKKLFGPNTASVIGKILAKHKIEILFVHFGTWGTSWLPIAKKARLPLIVSFHGYDASLSLKEKYYSGKLPELFAYASGIIISSPHMIDSLGLQPWMSKVHLIPYGVDPEEFKRSKPRTNEGSKSVIRILHSGRLVAKKGVPDLIRVFSELLKKYRGLEFHILGEGVEMEQCRSLADALGVSDRVIFYDAQPIAMVKKLMEESDIFVLNSRTDDEGNMEGLPNAILEAMSYEMPVVTTWHAGIPHVVKDQENGLLVPEKDNKALYLAIEKLIVNPELRGKLSSAGRKSIIANFTNEEMGQKLNRVIDTSGAQ
jgi:colanic acid/amylovoran biosynthesis glycosyltransferase